MDVLSLFAKAAAAKIDTVDVGGEKFHVRGLTAVQRAAFLQLMIQAKAENSEVPDHVIVAWGLCNPDGSSLPGTIEDRVEMFRPLDGASLYKAAAKILELSGFGRGAVERAEKNPKPAGAVVPAPAGAAPRQDRRATAAGSGRARRGR